MHNNKQYRVSFCFNSDFIQENNLFYVMRQLLNSIIGSGYGDIADQFRCITDREFMENRPIPEIKKNINDIMTTFDKKRIF